VIAIAVIVASWAQELRCAKYTTALDDSFIISLKTAIWTSFEMVDKPQKSGQRWQLDRSFLQKKIKIFA
jgi:hypothetical protein